MTCETFLLVNLSQHLLLTALDEDTILKLLQGPQIRCQGFLGFNCRQATLLSELCSKTILEKHLGLSKFDLGFAPWEAKILPQCYAAPKTPWVVRILAPLVFPYRTPLTHTQEVNRGLILACFLTNGIETTVEVRIVIVNISSLRIDRIESLIISISFEHLYKGGSKTLRTSDRLKELQAKLHSKKYRLKLEWRESFGSSS